MQVENMNTEQVKIMEKYLKEMQEDNKDLKYRFFDMDDTLDKTEPDAPDLMTRVQDVEDKIDALSAKLDRIFGNHFLIAGTWKQLE